jgi:hypothetical protein
MGVRLKVLEQEINDEGSPEHKVEIDANSDVDGDMEAQ